MKRFLSLLACGALLAGFATASHAQVNIDQVKIGTGNGNYLSMMSGGAANSWNLTIPDPGANVTFILSNVLTGPQVISSGLTVDGTFMVGGGGSFSSNTVTIGTNGVPGPGVAPGQLNILDGGNPGTTGGITWSAGQFHLSGGLNIPSGQTLNVTDIEDSPTPGLTINTSTIGTTSVGNGTGGVQMPAKVGIGQAPGADALDVTGNTTLTGTLDVTGILTAATGASGIVFGTGVNATTLTSTASAAQAISFPNNSGTLALLSDITSAVNSAVILAPTTTARNTVKATTSDIVPLTLQDIAAGTSDILDLKDGSGNPVASFSPGLNGFTLGGAGGTKQGILRLYNSAGTSIYTIAPSGTIVDVNTDFQADGNIDAHTATSAYKINGNAVLQNIGPVDIFVGVGAGSAYLAGGGGDCVGIGANALHSATTAWANTAVGEEALSQDVSAQGNTAVGWYALRVSTTGVDNTALGVWAMPVHQTGDQNTAVGANALYLNNGGGLNTAIGDYAGHHNTTEVENTYLGGSTDLTPGASNATAVGYGAVVGTSNTIQLGNGNVTLVNTSGAMNLGAPAATTAGSITLNTAKSGATFGGTLQLDPAANFTTIARTYSLPDNSGTLALLSDIGAFLPLAGGTMSGDILMGTHDISGGGTISATHFNATTDYQIGGSTVLQQHGTTNLFAGTGAGNTSVTGTDNVGIGNGGAFSGPLHQVSGGQYNTGVGANVLSTVTTGNDNTAVGDFAYQSGAGSDNTAIGYFAAESNTGGFNTAIGSNTLYQYFATSFNVAVGYAALPTAGSNGNSTAVGTLSLGGSTGASAGAENTGIGANSGLSNTTGSNNTFLGFGADADAGGYTNATAVGNGAVVTGSNQIQLGNGLVTLVSTSGAITSGGTVTGTNFSGPGTGLTGTATSLSIGGNAATATTASTVTTDANLTGPVTSTGNATSITPGGHNTFLNTDGTGAVNWAGLSVGASLQGTGTTGTGGSALAINVANANAWTAQQTFTSATNIPAVVAANGAGNASSATFTNTFVNGAAGTAIGATIASTGAGAGTNTALVINAQNSSGANQGIRFGVGLGGGTSTDIVGTSSSWKVTNAGAATFASVAGAGTGLTGTATSLSIGGNAATATTASALAATGTTTFSRVTDATAAPDFHLSAASFFESTDAGVAVAIKIPPPTDGRMIYLVWAKTSTLTITPSSGTILTGASWAPAANTQGATLIANASNWYVVGEF